jgi:hypothetical protein
MNDINYPVSLGKLEKFEKQNNISIHVFGYEKGCVFPVFLSKQTNGYIEADLLLISNEPKSHYCWIKSLDRFLTSQNKFHTKRYYCRREKLCSRIHKMASMSENTFRDICRL